MDTDVEPVVAKNGESMVVLAEEKPVVIAISPSVVQSTSEMAVPTHSKIANMGANNLVSISKENSLKEKMFYMASIISILLITLGLLEFQYAIPYYYTVMMPILIIFRYIQYWQQKWQYFLLDFCYFANYFCIAYIWAFPQNGHFFTVLFALANGPLAWAVVIFRNSVVFHNVDKMTSTFIHVIPPYLVYCIRWYPESISKYWYTSFINSFPVDILYVFIWLVAVPFGCFLLHGVLYMIVVFGILRPSEEYTNSFKHITTKTPFKVCTGVMGPNHHFLMYNVFTYTYGIASLLFTYLWYTSFAAHTVYIIIMSLAAFWNGAGYYLDVFGKPKMTSSN